MSDLKKAFNLRRRLSQVLLLDSGKTPFIPFCDDRIAGIDLVLSLNSKLLMNKRRLVLQRQIPRTPVREVVRDKETAEAVVRIEIGLQHMSTNLIFPKEFPILLNLREASISRWASRH